MSKKHERGKLSLLIVAVLMCMIVIPVSLRVGVKALRMRMSIGVDTREILVGSELVTAGRYEEGAAYLSKFIEDGKGSTFAYQRRGMAYMELRDYEKALDDFEHIEKWYLDSEYMTPLSVIMQAEILRRSNQLDEAYRRALRARALVDDKDYGKLEEKIDREIRTVMSNIDVDRQVMR